MSEPHQFSIKKQGILQTDADIYQESKHVKLKKTFSSEHFSISGTKSPETEDEIVSPIT